MLLPSLFPPLHLAQDPVCGLVQQVSSVKPPWKRPLATLWCVSQMIPNPVTVTLAVHHFGIQIF